VTGRGGQGIANLTLSPRNGKSVVASFPVRPGDELHIETEVLEIRPSKSRPDRGLVKMRTRTLNQRGEVVQAIINNAMVPRRATGDKQ